MITAVILLGLGVAFAVFAMLGSAERYTPCDHARPGDPKCEHCALGDEALFGSHTGTGGGDS